MSMGAVRMRSTGLLLLALGAVCALLLAVPGETVTTNYLNDLFLFLDGVHRIAEGQVPNRDFHTALGPLVYYAPAAGYWLSGNFGGAMPTGMALLVLALAPAAAYIVSSRLRPAIAIPLGTYLILVAAVPINLGESIGALSFAMFYNRIGWSALGLLLVMYLRPEHSRRHHQWIDTLCAAFLILLMLYIKISYGLVGLGFLALLLLDSRQRGWAAAAFAIVFLAGLVIELFWGGTANHIADLLLAGRVSGSVDILDELATVLFKNLADYVQFAIFTALALWRTRSLRDALFLGFCASSGYVLMTQNFQNWGIVTLVAGAAVAVETAARKDALEADEHRASVTAGAQLLLLALLLPAMIHNAAALSLHAGLALLKQGQAVPLANFDRIRLVKLWSEGEYPIFSRYLASLEDGAHALSSLEWKADHVFVLDFVGPFSAGLGLRSPHGDGTWHHWGRTVNEDNHLPAQTLLRDVHVVMVPKWPIEVSTAEGLQRLYGEYLDEHFKLGRETADWSVYVLRDPSSETVSRSSGSDPDKRQDNLPHSGG
jgi:hypothetical protein